ncbi:RxLR-like protein [Plasmopara halstedii]|uniref:RxLR-like protein n=1 Tax=Plasmopara halstedii TaxID=4781 RepID=A0A0N7L3Q0_PLAHL|nr:RxLR-like protein [Plasmopara halstedii]CEG36491.1 RxLR-like protein [Plasmopara halstedii]|eukprot:XP_024572860.1 RxLR-like protein [Plasmopara halstedii]
MRCVVALILGPSCGLLLRVRESPSPSPGEALSMICKYALIHFLCGQIVE